MTRPGGSHPFQETGVPREQEVFNGILRLFGRARCRLDFSQEGNGNRNCSLHLDLLFAGIGERLARVRRVVKNGKDKGPGGVPVASLVCNGSRRSSFDIHDSIFDIPR
jgi:hypothetical protein